MLRGDSEYVTSLLPDNILNTPLTPSDDYYTRWQCYEQNK